MILFFKRSVDSIIAVDAPEKLPTAECKKLIWLFGNAKLLPNRNIDALLVGPRWGMFTPWCTAAIEITRNMGIKDIARIENFRIVPDKNAEYDPLLQRLYNGIGQNVFATDKKPESIRFIHDIALYNRQKGLALSLEEINYLDAVSSNAGRKLTDSEVFGFSQVNSEHCRHKIFNGIFVIDGIQKGNTLFALIQKTAKKNPNQLVSAYKDNVAFNAGPLIEQFAPLTADKPDYFYVKNIQTVLSLKAETHNFPTTVEPFNGAATGSGGEIRDRMAGGKASIPIAGSAVYMTSFPRTTENREWEKRIPPRKWIYRSPAEILIRASDGASDYGNKFGQPLICGSVLTFEHEENRKKFAYDKVIMLAGGVGFANKRDALKENAEAGEKIIVMGGDNYRIGMGGGAVSSVASGEYGSGIETNAVQRANPEMQKRVANVIRALAESDHNPIVAIHDHGAGGHLNCLSELVETTGGQISVSELPVGDPTLSAKEIISNESQERMGLLLKAGDEMQVRKIAERECAPVYTVGETTGDHRLVFKQDDGSKPIDMNLSDLFGTPPRTVINAQTVEERFKPVHYDIQKLDSYLETVLQLESVACKDWLTNKVDRSVTGKIAQQQCVGELQLPLSDLGAVALDYRGKAGIATSIGHAPQAGLINAATGSVLAIAEALTNIVFAPLKEKLASVSLSANWMWPCKNPGEDARLYQAVKACSDFACALGINIPTGKDSLSMTQKYGDEKVMSPGTVIISAAAEVADIRKIVSPVLVHAKRSTIYYIDFSLDAFKLGGSAFAQSQNSLGDEAPTVTDAGYFKTAFNTVQKLIEQDLVLAGHDISAGGMITALLEMNFANTGGGLDIELDNLTEPDLIKILFSENPGILIQTKDKSALEAILKADGILYTQIGKTVDERHIRFTKNGVERCFNIDRLRDVWYASSFLLDRLQCGDEHADKRFHNYKQQPLQMKFRTNFTGALSAYGLSFDRRPSGIKAAVVREKGSNGDREMAYALYLAGFDVKDVHTSDLVEGRETLNDIRMLVFCGGFANSDVPSAAKGWAGSLRFNTKAKAALDRFYARQDVLSLGVCNGCQLMLELNIIAPTHITPPRMLPNDSRKFESAFVTLNIPKNRSVMLKSLAGKRLGVWIAHGEGKFSLPMEEKGYNIAARYTFSDYPGNPNGSPYDVAAICSRNGRHLAMMPHPERSIFPWQCAYYPKKYNNTDVTPWMEAFVNAREWLELVVCV